MSSMWIFKLLNKRQKNKRAKERLHTPSESSMMFRSKENAAKLYNLLVEPRDPRHSQRQIQRSRPTPRPAPFIRQENQSGGLRSLRDEMLAELERLRGIMGGDDIENNKNYINLPEKEKERFNEFLEFFSTCPVCKKKNHKSHLGKFYFETDPGRVRLKERLIKLMEESRDFNLNYKNKMNLGIPCCDCFNIIFKVE